MSEAGDVRCAHCGQGVPAGLRFCTTCGTPVPELSAAVPAAGSGPPTCRTCGTVLAPGLRFCVECGTALDGAPAPAPATYAASPAPAPDGAPRASRLPRILLVLVLVVLLAAGGVFGVALLVRDDPAPHASGIEDVHLDDDVVSVSPSSAPSAESSESAPPSPATPPTPRVRCWDGSRAERLAQCSDPSGFSGLKWVFPSLARGDCLGSGTEVDSDRRQIWDCTDHLRDGTEVEIHYSRWGAVAPAVRHYDSGAYEKTTLPGGIVRWLVISHDGLYKAALMYADAPWSVTLYAPTEASRDRALESLVELRPRTELRGTS